jgi:hypothetical protein
MSKDTGGAAFPFGQISEVTGQPINGYFDPGMTLRDYFAGQALPALIAKFEVNRDYKYVIQHAYGLADLMIAARGKT